MSETRIKSTHKFNVATIDRIAKEYKKIKYLMEDSLLVCEEESFYLEKKKDLKYYEDLKKKVEYVLMQMEEKLSRIIYNDFFSIKKGNWWIYNYSTSTYYRLKNKAMKNFLEWWYA